MDDDLKGRIERWEEAGILPTIQYDERPETIHKVWLHTYWFGWGPVYTYEGSKLPGRISKAWMQSVHPPYYRGTGIAIRFRNKTLRFGICHPTGRIGVDPLDESMEEIAAGMGAVVPPVTDDPSHDHWEIRELDEEGIERHKAEYVKRMREIERRALPEEG